MNNWLDETDCTTKQNVQPINLKPKAGVVNILSKVTYKLDVSHNLNAKLFTFKKKVFFGKKAHAITCVYPIWTWYLCYSLDNQTVCTLYLWIFEIAMTFSKIYEA